MCPNNFWKWLYMVKSVRVDDISELSLVPSISVYSMTWFFSCALVLCTQVNMFVLLLWVCIHTGQAEKFAWPWWTSIPKVAGSIPTVGKQTFQLARSNIKGTCFRFVIILESCALLVSTESKQTPLHYTVILFCLFGSVIERFYCTCFHDD